MDNKSRISSSFLQAISHHGVMRKDYACNILQNLHNLTAEVDSDNYTPITEDDVKELITEINMNINDFDQQIVYQKLDILDTEFLVFINTHSSGIDKLQTTYTESETNFFGLLLKEIAMSEEHTILPIDYLNLTAKVTGKGLSKSRAEELKLKWFNDGYLVEEDEHIYYGPRVLAEFASYLSLHFPDYITLCMLCKTNVIAGTKCDNCSIKLHRDCLSKYLRKFTNCPSCKDPWATGTNQD